MKKTLPALLLTLFLGVLNTANGTTAADDTDANATHSDVFRLGEVVVTAESDLPLGAADSITTDDMRQFNREDLAEALNLLPGITLSKTGARNERTVFVRGFDIKHVPIYLDGIPIYVMYDGYADLGRFTTFDLSRIAVSKGAASVLYGPNTMGGAINMISSRPEKPLEFDAGAGSASGRKYWGYGNFGANMGKWYVQAGVSYLEQDHFNLSSRFDEKPAEDGGHRENSYRTDSKVNLKIGYAPSDDSEYALRYIRQEGEKGTPPYAGDDPTERIRYWRWPQWDKESFYFTSKTGLKAGIYIKTRLYYDIYKNSLFSYDDDTYTTQNRPYAFKSWYNDDTIGGCLELGTRLFSNHEVKAAFHYKRDTHREHDNNEPERTFKDEIYSAGIEDTITLTPAFYTVTGIGYDRMVALQAQDYDGDTNTISAFDTKEASAFNPQVAAFYDISDTGTVHLSIARKSRLPTLKDRYSYRMGRALPNPDLDPEKSTNYELGFEKTFHNRLRLEGAVFFNDIEDYILFARVPDPDNPGGLLDQNQNVGNVHLYGAEAQIGFRLSERFDCGLTYTYTQWDNRSSSERITDIPLHKLFVFAGYRPFEWLAVQADVEHNSGRDTTSDGARRTEAFTVVNTKFVLDIFRNTRFEVGADNLFDAGYEINEGYPEQGVSYFAAVRYRY